MNESLIGKKIEETRKIRNLSLRELAKKAEITPSMLSQIEKNNANPSIQTLKSLAKALDVPVFTFLMDEVDTKELIVKKDNRKKMIIDGLHYELLSPDFTSQIATAIMRLSPGHSSSEKLLSHRGEEVAYVLEGTIHLNLLGEEYELNTGDSVKIPAFTEHKWTNKNDYEVCILFSVTPPSF